MIPARESMRSRSGLLLDRGPGLGATGAVGLFGGSDPLLVVDGPAAVRLPQLRLRHVHPADTVRLANVHLSPFRCLLTKSNLPGYYRRTPALPEGREKGRDCSLGPLALLLKRLALRVGPYLAVDPLDEGLAVLVLLLVLADHPELIGSETLEPLGDLLYVQLLVIGGLQRTENDGLLFGLPGRPLSLLQDFVGLLGGLLGHPETLPGYLLCCLEPLHGGLLGRPDALLEVGEGREEVPVGPHPGLGERPEALLLLARAPCEGLGSAHVVVGLLAHRFYGIARPALHEFGVALLQLQQLQAVREPLLGRPRVVLLQPHEREPAIGQPYAPA